MKCCKCGRDVLNTNHFYVPTRKGTEGRRYCIACAREENIITLV